MKVFTASPPDVLRVDEKHVASIRVQLAGVVLTTNYKERRHLSAGGRSPPLRRLVELKDFEDAYWDRIWHWY